MAVTVLIHPQRVRRLLTHPTGPVGRLAKAEGTRLTVAAKQRCPVDLNRLRSGIGHREFASATRVTTRVQTSTIGASRGYARAVHNGARPHWPPPGVLDAWAQRHGIPNGFLVARAIALNGTTGSPFLTDPLAARFPNHVTHAHIRR